MPRELPPLNALRAFEAAARLGGMSQAAEELNVTHGAVSRQVRLLEEHLAVELFIKDGRGVKLTDAGQRLSEVAADSFERVRLACSDIRRQAGEDAPFVLACPGSLLARWFIPRLDRLQRDLPELRLQLSASEELDPRRSGQDATLWFAEPPWPADMQVHELAPERIGPVLSPRHARFAELSAAAPERLLGEPLLHTTSRPQAWPQWASAHGLTDAALRLGQGFEHLYYLLEAAVAGLGVAIAPQALVADDLAAGRLAAPWGFQQTRASLALWVPARLPDRRAARLAQWLRGELGVKG